MRREYCSVRSCMKLKKFYPELSFFTAPKNLKIRKIWAKFAGIHPRTPYFRICKEHFDKKCFKTLFPRPLLVRDAIPTLKEDLLSHNCKVQDNSPEYLVVLVEENINHWKGTNQRKENIEEYTTQHTRVSFILKTLCIVYSLSKGSLLNITPTIYQ